MPISVRISIIVSTFSMRYIMNQVVDPITSIYNLSGGECYLSYPKCTDSRAHKTNQSPITTVDVDTLVYITCCLCLALNDPPPKSTVTFSSLYPSFSIYSSLLSTGFSLCSGSFTFASSSSSSALPTLSLSGVLIGGEEVSSS